MPTLPTVQIPAQERVSTGIAGLDDVLGGGLPVNRLYLVEGEPGAGKTTLGIQFLRDGVARGETALYVTLSETGDELRSVASSHGWTLDGISVFELVTAAGLSPEAEQSILHPSEVELGETTRGVMAEVERLRPMRVVFDSLSEMRLLAQDALRYRRQILALKHFFSAMRCTVLMLDDRSPKSTDLQLHSLVHGVLCLAQSAGTYGEDKRSMRVVKLRGAKYRSGDHDFRLDTGGISVFPRLVAAEHQFPVTYHVMSTGNARLDDMLGGGLVCGNNTLFMGPAGVGKTTTAVACMAAAMEKGEKATYYLFDEGLGTLLARCDALGIPARRYIEQGLFNVVTLDPAQVSPGEFASMVRAAVEGDGVRMLGIDSLNAYLQAMPGGSYLLLQMHELLTYLNQRGVATILILGQHGLVGEGRPDVDLSYLSDTIILFRFFEARGSLLKAISVVKSRSARHELTIREFRLGQGGVEVGQALTDFKGVMRGIPEYEGTQPLLSEPGMVVRS